MLPDGFKIKDVEELCLSVSRSLIRKVFGDLNPKDEGAPPSGASSTSPPKPTQGTENDNSVS